METIILDDFLDNGIIREKSFRKQVNELDLKRFSGIKRDYTKEDGIMIGIW